MAPRRLQCVERALEQLFRGVLHSCEGEPPQLRDVYVERDERNYGVRIRARFAVEGSPDYFSECLVEERDWQEEFRGERLGVRYDRRFMYDAGTLWSRMYEDHYVRRMQRAARDSAVEAYRQGDFGLAEHRRQMVDQIAQHASQNHTLFVRDSNRSMTATEVRMRQQQYNWGVDTAYDVSPIATVAQEYTARVSRDLARQMEERIMATLGLDAQATTSTTGEGQPALTVETIREAARALSRAPTHVEWRRAFVHGDMEPRPLRTLGDCYDGLSDLALYGSTAWFIPNPEVGTKEAQERGLQLLKDNLTPEQRQSYEANRYFDVKGGESGTTYRIHHGRQMNIEVLDEKGKRTSGLCALPQGGLVAGDCMLAQKVALECDEAGFLKIANRFA